MSASGSRVTPIERERHVGAGGPSSKGRPLVEVRRADQKVESQGLQEASKSCAALFVMLVWLVPSAFIT